MTIGTIDNPFKFADVIAGNTSALPGSTFILTPGVYDAPNDTAWLCTLNGSSDAHYKFIGQPGVIIGPITISGAYIDWEDCEFAYTHWTTRYSAITGSNPPGPFGWARLLAYGKGVSFKRCVIHDFADVGWGVGASDSLFEDCLTYHIGWDASDRAHGHGFYIQNDLNGSKVMQRCISVMNYATPAKIYGVDALLENIHINNSVFAYGKEGYTYVRSDNGAAHNITITNLYTYGIQWEHSNAVAGGGPIVIDGGVIVTDVPEYAYNGAKHWEVGITVRNLQIVGHRLISYWRDSVPNGWIDSTEYISLPPVAQNAVFTTFAPNSGILYNALEQWQVGTENDIHSTHTTTLPSTPRIEVIERTQDTVVVIYNWQNDTSIQAPIGGTYKNVFNLAESITVVYGETIPLDIWTVALPIGAITPIATRDTRFSVFIVT